MTRNVKQQQGVILIEALIGILIFSIGILALIGMQATAMKNTTDARYRSEAAFLANQVIAQMWVDRTNLLRYDDGDAGYAPRTAWNTQVAALLPGGLAPSILVPGGADNKVTVLIRWTQPGETAVRRVQMENWIN